MGDGLRAAGHNELEEIGRLYHAVWQETQAPLQPPSVAAFRDETFFIERVRNFPVQPLAAYSEDRLLGFAAWAGNTLGQLYIAPAGRKLGLGRALLQASEHAIWASGFDRARLLCLVGNHDARAFYERCGWRHAADIVEAAETWSGPVSVACWEMVKELKV
ncbi:GNAT family N-acetyltransferase [Microvirga sp. VF16]|uniref:GNAT family N-acetyltransferase n=1 Tax=Microvirga sp. VF16 TaxID=2807101 RepID=UPI00193E19D6|nr:GNAT family N-acetyltransferase [Microvirga sp. VF16]QRM28764.1 GNAT family N-acetyltransferase [Microvirga sp. VF16]